jgi:hypothetical protein
LLSLAPYPDKALTEIAIAVATHELKPEFPSSLKPKVREFFETFCTFEPNQRPSFQVIYFVLFSIYLFFFSIGNCRFWKTT